MFIHYKLKTQNALRSFSDNVQGNTTLWYIELTVRSAKDSDKRSMALRSLYKVHNTSLNFKELEACDVLT